MTPEPWVWEAIPVHCLAAGGEIAVDVGAHAGEWLEELARRYPRVWAFEPQMELAAELAARVPGKVLVLPLALSSAQEGRFFTTYADSAHLSGVFDQGGINTGSPTGDRLCLCQRLDAFGLHEVGLIKIDTEGMESRVLIGAATTIMRDRPLLVIEVHTAENGQRVSWMLGAWRYTAHVVRHPAYAVGSAESERHYWIIGEPA